MYKVICNYLHLNAGSASGSGLPELLQLNEELHCLLHIQQSPHCFDSLNKITTPLHKHYITHWLYTPNMLNVTNLSTLKTRYHCHYHCCCHSFAAIPPTTACSPATKSRGHIILWLASVVPFSTSWNVFFCLQALPACGHFCEKSPFLSSLPAPNVQQTWRQH